MYQALYRKWRPRTFGDVAGQGHITDTLKRQAASGRLSHAYLFTGTRGTGKTTCAKLLARAVNCRQPQQGEPCGVCEACVGIENGSILDVLELDAASNNRVDDIRAILEEAVYTPATVNKRVYIVDEVHMLSTQAFNALLQILEEPPPHLMFILATTEAHKVPATIKSRCQQFTFRRIRAEEITERLLFVAEREGISLTKEGAALIARLADGGMRDGLSLLDQCTGAGVGVVDEERVYQCLGLAGNLDTAALLGCVAEGDTQSALARLHTLYAGGKEMSALAGEMSTLVRDLLIRKTAPQSGDQLMTGGFDGATLRKLSQQFDIPRLVHMLKLLQATGMEMARSPNRRTDMELCLVTLCDPTLDGSTAGLTARIARLEQGMATRPVADPSASVKQDHTQIPLRRETPPAEQSSLIPETAALPSPVEDASSWEVIPEETHDGPSPEPVPTEAEAASVPILSEQDLSPVVVSAPEESPWPGWERMLAALRGTLDVSDFSFFSNAAMVQGSFEGDVLTLWADNGFIQSMIATPPLLEQVSAVAGGLMGRPIRVVTAVGSAPAEPSAPAQTEDALADFLAAGLDNLTVE